MQGVVTGDSVALGGALIVDELAETREIIGGRLCEVGFAVSYAEDGLDGFDLFVREEPDLIVTAWQMPRLNGIGLVRRVREVSDVPVVMLAAFGTIPDCEEAMRVGVDRYLQFRRDLHRVGEVARELMRSSAARKGDAASATGTTGIGLGPLRSERTGMTVAEARLLGRQELCEELQKQLLDCRGNVSEMARRMGKDRSTIRYHLRQLGMLRAEPLS